MGDLLMRIQQAQFRDRSEAEALVLLFVRNTFSLDVTAVELRPSAVSLNSFNGVLWLRNGAQLFFKTHTESDSAIGEYYNVSLLAEAGYPMLQPLYSSSIPGQQFLIYELVKDPSVFDLSWEIENGNTALLEELAQAQERADKQLLQLYRSTLAHQTPREGAQSPVHQLFYHRLAGGRLEQFYDASGVAFTLPSGDFAFRDIRRARWTINGQQYDESLDDLRAKGLRLLDPAQAGPSIIGHGDAHNGNIFFSRRTCTLVYFDPAFAGRHHPMLDLAKPMFHNVFAMWMYYPKIKQRALKLDVDFHSGHFQVVHNYHLPEVRTMFLTSKVTHVLIPILAELREHGMLVDGWRERLKSALFCCPLLTMNLADQSRFPPEIGFLGLAYAVEMGADSTGKRSVIDSVLDEVEAALV